MLVIGAGPAGLACGIAAARRGEKVAVLEKNSRPGLKLRLAGSGQCNLTHGGSSDDFLNHYGGVKKSRFVKPALLAFPNTETVRFFERNGVPLVEREDGKVFPAPCKAAMCFGHCCMNSKPTADNFIPAWRFSQCNKPMRDFSLKQIRGTFPRIDWRLQPAECLFRKPARRGTDTAGQSSSDTALCRRIPL